MNRRRLIQLLGSVPIFAPGALGRLASAGTTRAAASRAAGRFFTGPEMALLDELTELILPADDHSDGARVADVAGYIDGRLADYAPEIPPLREVRERWKAGLASIDALAREARGVPFLELAGEERAALLERLAANESAPATDGERFFKELKGWTARGYHTSRIGIHDELEYKGNTLLTEFVGTDPATLPPIRQPED
jgi:hypothetical protein